MNPIRNFLLFTLAAVALATVALASPSAEASVIRCKDAQGRISYQDKSCPNGAPGLPVDATPNQGFQFATKEDIGRVKRLEREEKAAEAARPAPRAQRESPSKARHGVNAGERRFVARGDHIDTVRRRIGAR